jgi:hypothetical protein
MIPLLLRKTQAEAATKLDLMPPPLRSMMEPTAMIATVERAIDFYRALARSGMQYFIIILVPGDLETLQLFKEQVLPAAAN